MKIRVKNGKLKKRKVSGIKMDDVSDEVKEYLEKIGNEIVPNKRTWCENCDDWRHYYITQGHMICGWCDRICGFQGIPDFIDTPCKYGHLSKILIKKVIDDKGNEIELSERTYMDLQ